MWRWLCDIVPTRQGSADHKNIVPKMAKRLTDISGFETFTEQKSAKITWNKKKIQDLIEVDYFLPGLKTLDCKFDNQSRPFYHAFILRMAVINRIELTHSNRHLFSTSARRIDENKSLRRTLWVLQNFWRTLIRPSRDSLLSYKIEVSDPLNHQITFKHN